MREINIEDFRQKYDEEINGIYKYDAVKNTVVSAIKRDLGIHDLWITVETPKGNLRF